MATVKPKVVVIGCGMAGLSAAAQLTDSGLFDVTILEAQSKPGGRIDSTWEMGNTVLELGANWIHGTEGNPVYELAVKHDLLEEDNSSGSGSSGESSSEESSSWIGGSGDQEEDLFCLENGTQVPREIAKGAMCFYSSLSEECQRIGEDGVEMAKYAAETVGDFLERMAEQKLIQLGLQDSVAKMYRLIFNWCLRQECVDNGCQTMKDVALSRFNDYKALPGDYYCTLGVKGYQGVLDVLLKKIYPGQLICNAPVTRIEWNWMRQPDNSKMEPGDHEMEFGEILEATSQVKHQALIKCENGDEYLANHVIITPSIGYLKRNHRHLFFPALPDDKQRTLDLFQFGTIDKIFLRYKKPFWKKLWKKVDLDGIQLLWDKDYVNADENQATVATSEEEIETNFIKKLVGFDTVEKHGNMLVGWISGREAEYMETLDDNRIGKICTKVLRKFLNNSRIPEPVEVLCTRWHSNQYICGAYGAFFPVGATGHEYDIMMEPVYGPKHWTKDDDKSPQLLFAGEAYHKEYHSTTHGAMVTGYTQADRLINLYKK